MINEKNIVENKISKEEKIFFDNYWEKYKKLLFESRDDKKLLQISQNFHSFFK